MPPKQAEVPPKPVEMVFVQSSKKPAPGQAPSPGAPAGSGPRKMRLMPDGTAVDEGPLPVCRLPPQEEPTRIHVETVAEADARKTREAAGHSRAPPPAGSGPRQLRLNPDGTTTAGDPLPVCRLPPQEEPTRIHVETVAEANARKARGGAPQPLSSEENQPRRWKEL